MTQDIGQAPDFEETPSEIFIKNFLHIEKKMECALEAMDDFVDAMQRKEHQLNDLALLIKEFEGCGNSYRKMNRIMNSDAYIRRDFQRFIHGQSFYRSGLKEAGFEGLIKDPGKLLLLNHDTAKNITKQLYSIQDSLKKLQHKNSFTPQFLHLEKDKKD